MNLFTKKKKKGFTIVELVIVIAVIGVLAAILIPTFVGLVNRANVAADGTLVRELNNAIALDLAEKGETKHETMTDALEATKEYGFDVSRINAKASKNKILWDSKNGVFCYLKDGKVEYVPASVKDGDKLADDSYELWTIASTVDETYSTYLYKATETTFTTTKGLDVGNENVTAVTYNGGTDAQDVVIRTNGGTLTVNATNDTVKHYGNVTVLNIEAVDTENCYREFGTVANAQIKKGKIVIESAEAKVENLLLVAKADKSGFEKIVVETKTGAELPTLDRTDVNIAEKGTLVLNVVTPSTDEYIYLTKAGVIEQIVVTNEIKNDVSGETANVASKSATTQAVAKQVANVGKKNADGYYVDSNNQVISVEDLTSENIVQTEVKASQDDLNKGNTLFAGGAGTERTPYLISNPEEFLNISSGSNIATKYYLLISNINFDEETYSSRVLNADPFNSWCLISNTDESQIKNINLDGGYHSLSLSIIDCGVAGANRLCLFGYLGGASTLENIDVIIDNYDSGENCFFTLVDYSGWNEDDHLTFKNITAKSNIQNATISGLLYNNGIFTSQTYYGKVDFINCDNYVNLNGTNNKYYAPYIGGYIQSYSQVSFTDCDNYGNLSGVGSAAMFIGNNTNINKNSVTITNSYNYGTIRAASASGLFAQNSNSANAREIEELYLASCNRGIISVQSFNGFTYSIKENEINYNLTNTNNVGKIVLRINGHTSVLDNNNEYIGARGFQITQEISPVNSTNGTFTYKLGQVIRQLDYNLDIELSNSNKIYDDGEYVKVYYVEKDNQAYYVFDDGYGNYSVSPNLSIAITAYSTSGSILGNAVLEND